MPFGDLVLPAIRWDDAAGFTPYLERIERWIELGVGGFILFGGERHAVRELTADLRERSARPLLIASDVERGAGQQVQGLTSLPPLGALAALGDEAVREAARLTALECRDAGINWALAPVCDLDIEPANPIVQTRSFGTDAFAVGGHAAAWIHACENEEVLACAKHFPGHGRTTLDSHATLPVVEAGRELERDLIPFRRAVEAQVAAVMSCHVAFPAWDSSGVPATHSRKLLHDLLRGDLFHTGLTVTDALIMEGAKGGGTAAEGAVRALHAGCDLLLYPDDPAAVIAGIAAAVQGGDGVLAGLAAQSSLRREQAARRAGPPQPLSDAQLADHARRGAALCERAVTVLRGEVSALGSAVDVAIVDDDAGGPYPLPSRSAFAEELTRAGIDVRPGGRRVVLLFADVKSWKGRAGLSDASFAALGDLLASPATVGLFGHPRRAAEIPGDGPVLCAWSGDTAMQRAAARRLAAR